MRLDDVAPRTVLLAGLAGWALLAWVLAIAGMGGHLPASPSGAIPGSRLPEIPKAAAPALGPLTQYGQIAARPLFATDRRPHAFSLDTGNGEPAAAPAFDFVLTSVLITPQAELAILQKPDGSESWRVRVGEAPDAAPGWRLVSIAPRSAVFEGPEGRKELTLRVFDGKGGASPTAVAPATAPVPSAPAGSPDAAASPEPPTDANAMPDPAQIEQIRQRIEARRAEMRRRAQTANPPATVSPPPAKR